MTEPQPAGRDKRLRARSFGLRGEWIALAFLLLRGYRVLARNFQAPSGEIDLVVARGRCIVFVEVKSRPLVDAARMAISAGQRQRIGRAAAYWLRRNGWATGYDLRADAIFIAPRRWPLHLENAFELDLG